MEFESATVIAVHQNSRLNSIGSGPNAMNRDICGSGSPLAKILFRALSPLGHWMDLPCIRLAGSSNEQRIVHVASPLATMIVPHDVQVQRHLKISLTTQLIDHTSDSTSTRAAPMIRFTR